MGEVTRASPGQPPEVECKPREDKLCDRSKQLDSGELVVQILLLMQCAERRV